LENPSVSNPARRTNGGKVLGVERKAVDAAMLDFDRTLVRLFQADVEKSAHGELLEQYAQVGLPVSLLDGDGDPYTLWTKAHQWMSERRHEWPNVEAITRRATDCLTRYEEEAATDVRLLDGVGAGLEAFRARDIPIVVVSTNSTDVIWRALRATGVDALVHHVVGRGVDFAMEELKPSPTPLLEGLRRCGCDAARALFAGDSIGDMEAGQRAGVFSVGLLRESQAARKELFAAGAGFVCEAFADLVPLLDEDGWLPQSGNPQPCSSSSSSS
jgi:phosphoglycolate phosphatase-like HAD superfamily hydrolase